MENYLRATQTDVLFEPTLDPVKMSQTSNNFSLGTSSSLLFSLQPQILDRRSRRTESTATTNLTEKEKSFEFLKQRFIKDKDKKQKIQAIKSVDRRNYNQSQDLLSLKRKEKEVVLYRRYRTGELPDLLINHLALLLPLQGLVKRDFILARQVFVAIFNGIVKKLGTDSESFIQKVSFNIEKILSSTKYCEPVFFGALMELTRIKPESFNISPDIIAVVSKASNMMTSGLLYLENRLNCDLDDESFSKVSSSNVDQESVHWTRLSEIYHKLSEYDVVAGIFSDKLKSNPALTQGLQLETEGDFLGAQQKYLAIINGCETIEKDFSYECYYNCFIYMSSWSDLTTIVRAQTNNLEEMWTDDWNQEHLLPLLMKSELRLILSGESEGREFLDLLEQWLQNPERSNYIKMNFGEDLMILQMANQKYFESRVSCEKFLTLFLSEWGCLNVLSNKLRTSKLLNARKVAEIYKYSDILMNRLGDSEIIELTNHWRKSEPKESDSMFLWDSLIAYRTFFSELFDPGNTEIKKSIYDMEFKFLDAAMLQGNSVLSDKIISRLFRVQDDPLRSLEFLIARSKIQILKSEKKRNSGKINLLLQAWDRLENLVLKSENLIENSEIHIKALYEIGRIGEKLLQTKFTLSEEMTRKIFAYSTSNVSQIPTTRLHNHVLWCFQQSSEIAQKLDTSAKQIGESYYKTAQFCYNSPEKTTKTEEIIMKSIFKAMSYESKEAQQLFPCILQFNFDQSEEMGKIFIDESALVPEWMFLAWIPQILSNLNFSSKSHLDTIIHRIAESYPAALIYPFRISYEQYKNRYKGVELLSREFIVQLRELLKNPLQDKFIEAFLNLCIPEMLLQFQTNSLTKVFTSKDVTNEKFREMIGEVVKIVYPDSAELQGENFQRILIYKEKFLEMKTLDGKFLFFLEFITTQTSSLGLKGFIGSRGLDNSLFYSTFFKFKKAQKGALGLTRA